ncbi:MAG TPA: hypothetical protein VGM23_15735 [Armatimonadota bacterium]
MPLCPKNRTAVLNKPDWDNAEARYTALWEGRNYDRPVLCITAPAEHIEPLVRQLDPALLCLDTWCAIPAEADALLVAARHWAA